MTVTAVRTPTVLRVGTPSGLYHAVEHGPQGLAPTTHCGRPVGDDWTVHAAHTSITCRDCLKQR